MCVSTLSNFHLGMAILSSCICEISFGMLRVSIDISTQVIDACQVET